MAQKPTGRVGLRGMDRVGMTVPELTQAIGVFVDVIGRRCNWPACRTSTAARTRGRNAGGIQVVRHHDSIWPSGQFN